MSLLRKLEFHLLRPRIIHFAPPYKKREKKYIRSSKLFFCPLKTCKIFACKKIQCLRKFLRWPKLFYIILYYFIFKHRIFIRRLNTPTALFRIIYAIFELETVYLIIKRHTFLLLPTRVHDIMYYSVIALALYNQGLSLRFRLSCRNHLDTPSCEHFHQRPLRIRAKLSFQRQKVNPRRFRVFSGHFRRRPFACSRNHRVLSCRCSAYGIINTEIRIRHETLTMLLFQTNKQTNLIGSTMVAILRECLLITGCYWNGERTKNLETWKCGNSFFGLFFFHP